MQKKIEEKGKEKEDNHSNKKEDKNPGFNKSDSQIRGFVPKLEAISKNKGKYRKNSAPTSTSTSPRIEITPTPCPVHKAEKELDLETGQLNSPGLKSEGRPISQSNKKKASLQVKSAPSTPRTNIAEKTEPCSTKSSTDSTNRRSTFKRAAGSFGSFAGLFGNKPPHTSPEVLPVIPKDSQKGSDVSFSEILEVDIKPPVLEEKSPIEPEVVPSLKLDDLINEQNRAELFRRNFAWGSMSEVTKNIIKDSQNYYWHTPLTLQTLLDAEIRLELQIKQFKLIEMIRTFLEQVLNPVFKNYLKETNDAAGQATKFCDYIRTSISSMMRTDLMISYKPVIEQLSFEDRKELLPQSIKVSQDTRGVVLFPSEFQSRAMVQMMKLWFYDLTFESEPRHTSVTVIATYFMNNMVKEEYYEKLCPLLKAITDINQLSWYVNRKINKLTSDLSQKKCPDGYCSLSGLIADKAKEALIIAKLIALFDKDQKIRRLKSDDGKQVEQYLGDSSIMIPNCMGDECELYISTKNQQLITLIQKTVIEFKAKYKTCFSNGSKESLQKNGEIITKLAVKLKDEVLTKMPEITLEAETETEAEEDDKNTPRRHSRCF